MFLCRLCEPIDGRRESRPRRSGKLAKLPLQIATAAAATRTRVIAMLSRQTAPPLGGSNMLYRSPGLMTAPGEDPDAGLASKSCHSTSKTRYLYAKGALPDLAHPCGLQEP